MIDILLATYNGEKYIKAQIHSLLCQTYEDWNLLIHDDGSNDRTLEIIKNLQKLDSRITLIEDGIKCGGAGDNFLYILKNYSRADYAIFCDQDDIWLETKVQELYEEMLKFENKDKPSLVYCDAYPWDSQGNIHNESISTANANSLDDFIMLNAGYQGCSIIINKCLIDMAKSYEGYIHLHDDLVSLIAHSFGRVKFHSKKLMLYRQHKQAVTGEKSFEKKRLGGLFNNVGYVISKKHLAMKKDFYKNFGPMLPDSAKRSFLDYFAYCDAETKRQRVKLVLDSNLTWAGDKNKLIAKTLLQDKFDL